MGRDVSAVGSCEGIGFQNAGELRANPLDVMTFQAGLLQELRNCDKPVPIDRCVDRERVGDGTGMATISFGSMTTTPTVGRDHIAVPAGIRGRAEPVS